MYRESRGRITQTGKPLLLPFFSLGMGPGQSGSLLLLTMGGTKGWQVLRVSNAGHHKICDFFHETQWGDPELFLSEASKTLSIQSFRTGETPLVKTWSFQNSWSGPIVGDLGDLKSPVNGQSSVSIRRLPGDVPGDYRWNVQLFRDDSVPHRVWKFKSAQVSAGSERPYYLTTIPSLSNKSVDLISISNGLSSVIKLRAGSMEIWKEGNSLNLGENCGREGPVIEDSRGQLWVLTSPGVFKVLLLQRSDTVDIRARRVIGRAARRVSDHA